MINKTIQNKNLKQNIHELLIINNLKQLSNLPSKFPCFLDSKKQGNLDCEKESTIFSFHNVNKQKISSNLIKKSSNFQWLNYFFYNNPINLLFSIDQFLFEFAKKQPQRRKSSEFQQQLKERKKLCLFYGHLSKKQLQNLVSQSKSYQGYFSKNFFSILERRLDILLYRSGLVKNIITARQLISHKKIKVNNQILNSASYQVNPGDIISILSTDKKSTILSKSICTKFKKRPSHFTISPKFVYKLENYKNYKNFKQKKTLENYIRLLLTRIEKRAHLRIKKSPILFFDLISKSKTISFLPSLHQLYTKTFTKRKNFTLLKLKPLLSKQAKFFLLIYRQKNYLSGSVKRSWFLKQSFKKSEMDRKPLFQNKYTRFINLLEKNIPVTSRFSKYNSSSDFLKPSWSSVKPSFTEDTKKDLEKQNIRSLFSKTKVLENELQTKTQENTRTFQKSKNAFFYEKKENDKWKNKSNNTLKSFTRKLSNSTFGSDSHFLKQSWSSVKLGFTEETKTFVPEKQNIHSFTEKKNSFLKTSSIYNRKRALGIYRNSVYKMLLQMYSMPFYEKKNHLFFDEIKKECFLHISNIQKKRIKSLLTLKLKKYSAKKRSRKQILRALRFVGIKPMHLEVSYSLSTVILLFSPQRLNFPFYIDIDLVLRSFR